MRINQKKKVIKTGKENLIKLCLLLPCILICMPILLIVTGSFFDVLELQEMIGPVFMNGEGFVSWKWMPDYPTLSHYGKLLFMTPQFFVLFWNSLKMVCLILLGQLLVGIPAAWGFSAYAKHCGRKLFLFYVVLMLLPFQVTMLSTYLVLHKLHLLNNQMAVILPAIFSTFPIFLIYGSFRAIPMELIAAARIDGAREGTIFLLVGLPLGKSGILSAVVLGFLEYWNMIEQPMAFLENKALWPLSLYLPEIAWSQAGYAFCASIFTLIPSVFIFMMGQEYLEQGIIYSGLKL